MPGSTFSPVQAWLVTVRAGLREWIRRNGQVPSLICAVSAEPGTSPAKARFDMRLDLLEDRLAVQAHIQAQVRAEGSRFVAVGGITSDRLRFALCVVQEGRAEMWSAEVSARRGLGGWERGGADAAVGWEWVEKAIEEAGRGD